MALTGVDLKAIEAEIPSLRRYSRTLTDQADAADDLVQDTLERAIERFDQFRPGTNLRAWLFTILHNIRCDQYRRAERRGPEIPIEEVSSGIGTRADQADQLHLRGFRRAFGRLNEPHRQALSLATLEGMGYVQIAAMLGVQTGTVKSRVFRAREKLRRELRTLRTPTPKSRWHLAA